MPGSPVRKTPLADDRQLAVVDACTVLNVSAAGCSASELACLGYDLIVARPAAEEALYLHDEDSHGRPVRTPVSLDAFKVIDLPEAALAAYVALAVDCDDGEAASLALASALRCPVVTDDRKALRLAAARVPPISAISTATVIAELATSLAWPADELRRRLLAVESRANFTPPARDPLAAWWRGVIAAP